MLSHDSQTLVVNQRDLLKERDARGAGTMSMWDYHPRQFARPGEGAQWKLSLAAICCRRPKEGREMLACLSCFGWKAGPPQQV